MAIVHNHRFLKAFLGNRLKILIIIKRTLRNNKIQHIFGLISLVKFVLSTSVH